MVTFSSRRAADRLAVAVPQATTDPVAGSSPGSSAAQRSADEALLSALRSGGPGTGSRFYQHLAPVVDATLFRVLGCRDADHADLVQSVFEQLVMTIFKQRYAAKCSLTSWASVIACHVGLTALRSRRRRRGVFDLAADPTNLPQAPSSPPNPEQLVGVHRALESVRRHLSEMDEDRATALLLHAMGNSVEEIASLTSVSIAAAQSRLSRGRRELQTRMRAEDEAHTPDDAQGRDS